MRQLPQEKKIEKGGHPCDKGANKTSIMLSTLKKKDTNIIKGVTVWPAQFVSKNRNLMTDFFHYLKHQPDRSRKTINTTLLSQPLAEFYPKTFIVVVLAMEHIGKLEMYRKASPSKSFPWYLIS